MMPKVAKKANGRLLSLMLILWLVSSCSSSKDKKKNVNTGKMTTEEMQESTADVSTESPEQDGNVEIMDTTHRHHDVHIEGRLVSKSESLLNDTADTDLPPVRRIIPRRRKLQFILKEEHTKGKLGSSDKDKTGFQNKFLLRSDTLENVYPPFSYKGFHDPPNWHLIPPHYFNMDEDSGSSIPGSESKGISALKYKLLVNRESHCADENPAPIDIITENAEEDNSFSDFNFRDFDTKFKFDMFIPEDGTDLLVVKFNIEGGSTAVAPAASKGSIIGRELKFDSILIRFGSSHKAGSEHFINGKQMGMELQFIFKDISSADGAHRGASPSYWDLADAVNTFAGHNASENDPNIIRNFIMICVLVDVKDKNEDVSDEENNEGVIYLAQAAKQFWHRTNVHRRRAFTSMEAVLSLKQFLQVPIQGPYYTYSGTLTFPPCLEFFRYSVFSNPIVTDYRTWQSFQFVHSEFSDTGFMADNFRPLHAIFIKKPFYDEFGVPMEYVYRPYLQFKEEISRLVRKSRLISDKEKNDDYDYYEIDTDLFKERKRNISRRRGNSTAFKLQFCNELISVLIIIALFMY